MSMMCHGSFLVKEVYDKMETFDLNQLITYLRTCMHVCCVCLSLCALFCCFLLCHNSRDGRMLVPKINDFNNLNITPWMQIFSYVITVGTGCYQLMQQKDAQQNHQIYPSILPLTPSIRGACVLKINL